MRKKKSRRLAPALEALLSSSTVEEPIREEEPSRKEEEPIKLAFYDFLGRRVK